MAHVQGAQRPAHGVHRVEHGGDLPGANLTDQHAAHGLAQHVGEDAFQGDLPGGSPVQADIAMSFAGLDGDDPVELAGLVQPQLPLGLHGGEPLPAGDLGGHRPHQRGLARVRRADDDDVQFRVDQRGQELPQDRVDRAQGHHVVEVDLLGAVPADHQHRRRGDHMHRRKAVAVGQTQVQRRLGGGQSTLVLAGGGGALDHLQQLGVTVRGEGAGLDAAVGEFDANPPVAVDHHVLDPRVADDGLQPAEPEQVGQHRVEQNLLLLVTDALPGGTSGIDVGADHLGGDVLTDGAAILHADVGAAAEFGCEQARGLFVQGPHDSVIRRAGRRCGNARRRRGRR